MDQQLETRMADWLKWYNWHHSMLHNSGLEQRVAFLDKCVQGLFELVVKVAEEGDRLDHRRDRPIVLPTGIVFNDPIRKSSNG